MATLKNLFGLRDKDQAKNEFPARVEILADKLSAVINLVDIETPQGQVSCWTYTTDGLKTNGQKEMMLILSRQKNERAESFPQEPINLFGTFEPFGRQGQIFDVGDVTEFGGPGPFGKQLAYLPPLSLGGLNLPSNVIIPFLVDTEECNSVNKYGVTRFMARLGQLTNYYPAPIWSDRGRKYLPIGVDNGTVLEQVERVHVPEVFVYQDGDAIILRNSPEGAAKMKDDLPMLMPLALLTGLEPSCDACLVWNSGQDGPQAITQPGTNGDKMGGCFIMFVPEQPQDEWQILEDGFVWMVTRASWDAIRKVLSSGKSIRATMKEERLSFSLL